MRGASIAPLFAVTVLLAGCGSSTVVTVIEPADLRGLNTRIEGESRVVFRSGETERTRQLELHDGTATWRTPGREAWQTDRELAPRSAPVSELDALQVRTADASTPGLILGLVGGVAAGGLFDAPGWRADRVLYLMFGGVAGAVAGSAIGSAIASWEDLYVFEVDEADTPSIGSAPSGPPGSPGPPGAPARR